MTCREQKHQTELIQLTSDQLKGEGLELVLMDLRQKDFDGLLLVGADIPKDSVRSFMKLHIPLVLIDAYYPDLPCNAVTVDNLNGGRLAATYLCDRYHCEPWYLRCRYRADSFNDRIAGFMEAIRDRALSRRKVEVLTISPSTEDARDDVLTFVEENKGIPRCLFAETDQLALGAAQAFLSLGLRIPEDVAIVGFDNIVPAREFNPALTTIDYPKAFMGIEAAKKLLDLVSHPTEYVTNTKVAVSLVQRASA